MTRHEFLTWAIPFFTITTILGAALSITRLLSKRSKPQSDNFVQPFADTSSFVTFQPNGGLLEKGAPFVYIIAALGLVLAISTWVHH